MTDTIVKFLKKSSLHSVKVYSIMAVSNLNSPKNATETLILMRHVGNVWYETFSIVHNLQSNIRRWEWFLFQECEIATCPLINAWCQMYKRLIAQQYRPAVFACPSPHLVSFKPDLICVSNDVNSRTSCQNDSNACANSDCQSRPALLVGFKWPCVRRKQLMTAEIKVLCQASTANMDLLWSKLFFD